MHDYGDDAEQGPTPLPAEEYTGTGARVRAAMGSAEGLGVAALLLAALMLSSLPQLVALAAFNFGEFNNKTSIVAQGAGHGAFAVITVVLACAAIARADVFSPPWVRGVAGGAAVAGLIGFVAAISATVLPFVV